MFDVDKELRELHDDYVGLLSLAVAEGRDDMVAALATEFDRVSFALVALEGGRPPLSTPPDARSPIGGRAGRAAQSTSALPSTRSLRLARS
jgi:hypothetical protein